MGIGCGFPDWLASRAVRVNCAVQFAANSVMPLFVTKLPQFLADLDRLTAQDFGQKVGDGINQSQLIEGATLVGPEQTTAPCQNLLKDDLTEKNVRHPLRVGMQLKSDGIHSIGMIPRFAWQGGLSQFAAPSDRRDVRFDESCSECEQFRRLVVVWIVKAWSDSEQATT
jgi:hypothetical protein